MLFQSEEDVLEIVVLNSNSLGSFNNKVGKVGTKEGNTLNIKLIGILF